MGKLLYKLSYWIFRHAQLTIALVMLLLGGISWWNCWVNRRAFFINRA